MGSRRAKKISYVRTHRLETDPPAETISADVERVLAQLVAQAYLRDHPIAHIEQTSEDQEADREA